MLGELSQAVRVPRQSCVRTDSFALISRKEEEEEEEQEEEEEEREEKEGKREEEGRRRGRDGFIPCGVGVTCHAYRRENTITR